MGEPRLVAVRTHVVLATLVDSMADAVSRRLDDPLDAPAEAALASAGVDARLARMGYLARALESERFDRAREPMPWLAAGLRRHRREGAGWSEAATALAIDLATGEPLDRRPDPADEAAISWRIPGPGGHVRHYLAMRAAVDAGRPDGPDAKRSWLIGFLIRCIWEAEPPDSA